MVRQPCYDYKFSCSSLSMLFVVSSLLIAVISGAAQTPKFTVEQPSQQNRPVRIITTYDPEFRSLLKDRFASFEQDSSAMQLSTGPMVIIKNQGQFSVQALALKWILVQNSKPTVIYQAVYPEPHVKGGLPGVHELIAQGHVLLVAPSGSSDEASTPSWKHFFLQQAREWQKVNGLDDQGPNWSVSIDSIVFKGGLIVGHDNSGLRGAFECERNGAIDEAMKLVEIGQNELNMRSVLTADSYMRTVEGEGTGCVASRSREATRLLQLLDDKGLDEVLVAINKLARSSHIRLHGNGI